MIDGIIHHGIIHHSTACNSA